MTSRNNKPIIEVKGLSKEYRIGMDRTYKRFTESFTNAVCHPVRTLRGLAEPKDTFWALKDINFEVERGEVLGIIGRNGAGKSTLLKILSRITYPTKGEVIMRGRVGSLLEVGTGFHPELTGRENIYFNGAILGMKKKEIDDKFDEIIKFSGVEKFLDTPVKRYSSGMNVRLAFSVAAHLDPEILLVDEVLAVGDAEFQKKCLHKMGTVANEGRTVLLISHNMTAIQNISQRAVYLKDGKIMVDSVPKEAISYYLSEGIAHTPNVIVYPDSALPGNDYVKLKSVRVYTNSDSDTGSFEIEEDIFIEITFLVRKSISNYHTYIRVSSESGTLLFGSGDWDGCSQAQAFYTPGQYKSTCKINGNLLNHGAYLVSIFGQIPHKMYLFQEENVLRLNINELSGAGGAYSASRPGFLRPVLDWIVEKI